MVGRTVVVGDEPARLVGPDAGHVERDPTPGRPGPWPASSPVPSQLLRGVGAAIAFVVLIAWNHPTALTVLGVAVLFVVYLVVLELLGRSATHEPVTDTTTT